MTEKFIPFYTNYLGQWGNHPMKCIFTGIEFNCAEQYMMYCKAELFGDEITKKAILETNSPARQKILGRQVKNFDRFTWDKVARDIVYDGNFLKFSQNDLLQKKLFSTAGFTLVEASPTDLIWGAGIAENDPRIHDRASWRGKNWLGQVLTRLRDDLMNDVAKYGASRTWKDDLR
jgi:hypothetical protein